MASKNWRVMAAGLCLLGASCGEDGSPEAPEGLPQGMTPVASSPDAGSSAPDASSSNPTGNPNDPLTTQPDAELPQPEPEKPVTQAPYDYELQAVTLTSDLVIPAGKIFRVGPGVKITAKQSVKIDVLGTLMVEGTSASPVSFHGNGSMESWPGIVVQSGGKLFMENAKVNDGRYGIRALPGSTFSIDRTVFATNFKGAVLESSGTLKNSTFKAVPLFPAVTESVSIDDPNGYLTIINASPTVTNCQFDGSGGLNDMVRVGGNSSPTFDHCNVNNSHCGFHTSGGTNTSARITNTVFSKLSYGIMAFATRPIIESSEFRDNANDVGFCNGATTANTPQLKGNFYAAGALRLDSGCTKIETKDSSASKTAIPNVGPSGL